MGSYTRGQEKRVWLHKIPNLDKPELKFCHFAQEIVVKCLTVQKKSERLRKFRLEGGWYE